MRFWFFLGGLSALCHLAPPAAAAQAQANTTAAARPVVVVAPPQPQSQPQKRDYSANAYFVLELANPSVSPDQAAQALDVQVVEQVGELEGHWLVAAARDTGSPATHDATLARFDRLRRKRAAEVAHVVALDAQRPRQRVKRVWTPDISGSGRLERRQKQQAGMLSAYLQDIVKRFSIQDPIFPEQWHLANDRMQQHTINVTGVWDQGITGSGVGVAVIDDGLDMNSDDLKANFFAEGSWDFNDHTPLPEPRLVDDLHGTRCAGEIAAVKNDVCGMGVAYDAKIAGIRILSAAISDADEAASLNFAYQHNDVYSCSWGPPDDGRSCEAPSRLITKAMLNGVQKGRAGKGSVFVFASGNGGAVDDQCNFDGYTNSIYSITVGAIDRKGLHPYYSEACAAVMVVTYSSGSGDNIHTTDVGQRACTARHGGTSAAAPIAAGVVALLLSVRPDLTWRDVQHLCVNTALVVNDNDPDWSTTFAGRPYNHKYGYGKLDTWAIVEAAKTWPLVKPQAWWESAVHRVPEGQRAMTPDGAQSQIDVTPQALQDNNFERLEHITVRVDIEHQRRGNIEVELVSPNGIVSSLARPRRFDNEPSGLEGWQFMTVKHWGENPIGKWTLNVRDRQDNGKKGDFLGWTMSLWGESRDASLATPYTLPHDAYIHLPPQPTDKAQPKPGQKTEEELKADEEEQMKEEQYENEVFPSPEPKPGVDNDQNQAQQWTTATTTKARRPKPTEHLPDDHDVAQGHSTLALDPTRPSDQAQLGDEAAEDARVSLSAANPSASSAQAQADTGYLGSMASLMKDSTWFFFAAGLALLLGGSLLGYFLWRRWRQRRGRGDHPYGFEPVAGEESGSLMVPMSERRTPTTGGSSSSSRRTSHGGPTRTRDLYDAFGVDSSDEEEEEEKHAAGNSARRRSNDSAEELFNSEEDHGHHHQQQQHHSS